MSFLLRNEGEVVRPSEDEELPIKRKILFFSEGASTEPIYLEGLINYFKQNVTDIDKIFDYYIIDREIKAHSHQLRIVEKVQSLMQEFEELSPHQETVEKLIEEYQLSEHISYDEFVEQILSLNTKFKELLVEDRLEINQYELFTKLYRYDKDIDKIIIILDRDYQSFKEKQYKEALKICDENNFLLGLTNPNFEFFLLLHFTNGQDLNYKDILENKRIGNKKSKRYVEDLLTKEFCKKDKAFKKNYFDSKWLIDNHLQDMLNNSKLYKESTSELINDVGSSLPKIIQAILDNKL